MKIEKYYVQTSKGKLQYNICGKGKPNRKNNRMMPEEVRLKRLDHQLELLTLSENSKHIVAKKVDISRKYQSQELSLIRL